MEKNQDTPGNASSVDISNINKSIKNLSNFANLFKSKKLELTRPKESIVAKFKILIWTKFKKSDLAKAIKLDL